MKDECGPVVGWLWAIAIQAALIVAGVAIWQLFASLYGAP